MAAFSGERDNTEKPKAEPAPKHVDNGGAGCLLMLGLLTVPFSIGQLYGTSFGWLTFGVICLAGWLICACLTAWTIRN